MAKKVNILQPFNDPVQFNSPEFNKTDFQDSIWNRGYNVIHEKTVKCPCRYKGSDHLSSCQNCQGTGWVVIDATKTKMLLTSLNSSTKYKAWSQENLGTVAISADIRDKLAFMDKITVLDSLTVMSELLYPKSYNDTVYSYTIYEPKSVKTLFKYISDTEPLQRLTEGIDYTVDRNKIIFINQTLTDELRFSIRYEHNIVYGIIDLPHDVRNSFVTNSNGQNEVIEMPIQAVGRRFHYLVDALNFNGDNLIDNSLEQ